MGDRVSLREFARLDGCTDKVVRRGIAAGRLPRSDDGKMDSDLARTGWRAANISAAAPAADTEKKQVPGASEAKVSARVRSGKGGTKPVRTIDTPEQAALRKMGVPLAGISLAKKAHIAAQRDQLDFDKAVGKVVLISEVAAVVGRQMASVRTRLLAIPAEHAPRLAMIQTATEMQDALQALIVEALTELVQDVGA